MNPVTVELVVRCYYAPVPVKDLVSKACIDASNRMLRADILAVEKGKLECTERGRHWVAMLLNTPLPEKRWVDPRTEE